MKVVSSLKSLKKEISIVKWLEEEENFTLLIKKIQNLRQDRVSNFMDINSQKETWSNFKNLTVYISAAIILVLILMAIFLL
jgi:hypothetical protein